MKTLSYNQALAELTRIFGSFEVTDKVDTLSRLEIYFTTQQGQNLVLLADECDYFQRNTNFEIFEA